MADIISRLKLESGEFDSKIKRAGQELMAYSEHCRKTGLEMGYANRDAKEFAKALGNMQTTSATARGKISELSDAFVNLRVMYKNMTDEEKNNQFGKNLAASLDQLKTRIQDAKKDLADVTAELNGTSSGGKGGFLSGSGMSGMLQVFGGNLMTKGAGMLAELASEMGEMVKQGIELAQQGEGIRIAFERLNRPDILDNLRQATHGTVTDLELMKQAVKFNDFKLPLDQMGTLLAFAQQKAKDTGQSVDYMVDSIVTGLGRQSLMILDNLGLSASQIKDRMKETGDMTTAVADIIREQMSAAGDYVETAADRATQADVELKNAMEELGRTLLPLQQEGESVFTGIETAAINALNSGVAPLIPKIIELKSSISELYTNVSESSVFKGLVNWMEAGIDATVRWIPLLNTLRGLMQGNGAGAGASVGGAIAAIVPDYQEVKNIGEVVVTGNAPAKRTGRSSRASSTSRRTADDIIREQGLALQRHLYAGVDGVVPATDTGPSAIWRALVDLEDRRVSGRRGTQDALEALNKAEGVTPSGRNKGKKNDEREDKDQKLMVKGIDQLNGGISSIFSGLEQIGIEIPEELRSIFGVVQGVTSILMGIATTIIAIEALVGADALIPFANGGIVGKAAGGMLIPGNSYSGDNLRMPVVGGGMIGVNSGEVILNRAQAGNLASQLQGSGFGNSRLVGRLKGRDIIISIDRELSATGRGQMATWK